jgi:hypothetical protein
MGPVFRLLAPLAATTDVVWGALATVLGALIAGFAAWYVPAWRLNRETRSETARALRYTRDPLLRAAFDLQSRFYNIVARDFLGEYLRDGSQDDKQYAVMSTLWILGQYLGWVEILRREVQYLDLGSQAANRTLQLRLSDISAALASDSRREHHLFVIFRADQRAIGEFMVTSRETETGGRRPDCLGYSEFLVRFQETKAESNGEDGPPLLAWASRYEEDLAAASASAPDALRLVRVQRRLIDLVDLLDPDRVRYPEVNFRGKLPLSGDSAETPRHVAWFLWRHADPWPLVENWARASGFRGSTDGDDGRTYVGKRGLTGWRPQVHIDYHDGWLSVDACVARRNVRRPVDGSLTAGRGRAAVNRLLQAFDRPTIRGGSTLPARGARRLAAIGQRLRRGGEGHGS